MNKLTRLALIASMLSVLLCVGGCTEEVMITPSLVNKAAAFCDNNEGLKTLVARSYIDDAEANYLLVECINGASFKLKAENLDT